MPAYRDRQEAGRFLANKLTHLRGHPDTVVLGLPRGGVPVAYEVADMLQAPLDVFIVRKLGLPLHEELAIGALASGGILVLNDDVIETFQLDQLTIKEVIRREEAELHRRETLYRGNRPPLDLAGKTVIVVDDGLATGSTMKAAVAAIRQRKPRSIIVAAPVAAYEACERLRSEADEVYCAHTPEYFVAVGLWYQDFTQTTDGEVRELLERAAHAQPAH